MRSALLMVSLIALGGCQVALGLDKYVVEDDASIVPSDSVSGDASHDADAVTLADAKEAADTSAVDTNVSMDSADTSAVDADAATDSLVADTFADTEAAMDSLASDTFEAAVDTGVDTHEASVCPAGSFVAGGVCMPCTSGFTTAPNSTACTPWTPCAAGTEIVSAGTPTTDQTCTPCANGYSKTSNSTSCTSWTACEEGSYVSTAGTTTSDQTCSPCAAGSYSNAANATSCTQCAFGSFSAAGATACTLWTPCQPGTYLSMGGNAISNQTCTACKPGTFSGTQNANTCAACGPYSYSAAGATSCTPWTTCTSPTQCVGNPMPNATTNRSCWTCPNGTYTTAPNQNCPCQ